MGMFESVAVGLPGLIALSAGYVAFVASVMVTRAGRRDEAPAASRKSAVSIAGIVLQGIGFGLASFGNVKITLAATSPAAIVETLAVVLLLGGSVGLFTTAARAMGQNWSFVARTRSDHELVTSGPFSRVRHPIYLAMLLQMLALTLATGHWGSLVLSLPLFVIGTGIRVREEERLLRTAFGPAYDAYAGRVRRFVPGVF
jgi:protein-S-isoprenylcysteine O-methyltransferase Ste14